MLAADSRVTSDSHIICDTYNKLHYLNEVKYLGDELLIMGVSGSVGDVDFVLKHIHGEDFPGRSVGHDLAAIIVGKNYVYELEDGQSYLLRYNKDTLLARGSGSAFARSAMVLGLDALEAVQHSIQLDTASGGTVKYWVEGE